MSAMSDMSRAIRTELQQHAPSLSQLGDDFLKEYVVIIGAFYTDLREEAIRRGLLEDTR